MLTSAQRARLRGLAVSLRPIAQIGKEGISEPLLSALSADLDAHELIKITILPASASSASLALALASDLSARLRADLVALIGRKIILYRRSPRTNFNHIRF